MTAEEKCVNTIDAHNKRFDSVSSTIDFAREMLSNLDERSSVAVVDTVGSVDPETVLTTVSFILSTASKVAVLRLPDITMIRILASLKRIEGCLAQILEAPLRKAIDTFEFILKAAGTGNFESAYDKLEKLIDNAETAVHYTNKNDFSIESYRECAKATRLLMFGHLLKESYDKAKTVFLPPDQLPTKKVTLIGQTLEMIVRKSIEQKKKVITTSWGILRIQDDSKKSEAQDILDSILKFGYPFISRAKKLTTDMTNELKIQDFSSNHHKFGLLPDVLPMGREDATQLTLGFSNDSDGKKSLVKVIVWKEEDSVWCEYENFMGHVKLESQTGKVMMELPVPRPLKLIATGDARKRFLGGLGDYRIAITMGQHEGRPVYTNSEDWNLYSLPDGTWGVDCDVGDSQPEMRSTDKATSPDLCQNWEYKDHRDGNKYKHGDVKVEINVSV